MTPDLPEINDTTFIDLSNRYYDEFGLTKNEDTSAYRDMEYSKVKILTPEIVEYILDYSQSLQEEKMRNLLNSMFLNQ